jgi:hypothetical protein
MKAAIKKILTSSLLILMTVFVYGMPVSDMPDWTSGKVIVSDQQSIVTDDSGSPVDFETGDVISISEAGNLAFRRAKDTAIVSAMEMLKNIRIDSRNTFQDLLENDNIVRQRLSDFLNYDVRSREVYVDYLTRGAFIEFKICDLIKVINYDFPERDFPLRNDVNISTRYTSLIVDTRGLNVKPMLLPVVYNENGLEVYSKDYISAVYAVKHNAVSYVYNEKEALKHIKAGEKPYFCVALKSIQGSPVLSDDDLKKVYSDKKNLDSLRKCRVIFIIDRVYK